jgi:2-polyprenyl-3-methyl-5-hydroxy-6-metoxy-1,4-benzoquinol methylase
MTGEFGFFEAAERVLSPVLEHEALGGLLEGLHASGALRAMLTPVAAARWPETVGTTPEVAAALLQALLTHQVVEDTDDGVALTPPWRALVADTAYADLGDGLRQGRITSRLLAAVGTGDYWDLPPKDLIAFARSVSPDPYAEGLVAAFRADIGSDPDRADLITGCHVLELGCGVAGRILTMMRAAPGLTAVGVELSQDLAAEASRRADELGLTERFTVVCADAAQFSTDERFDRVFWSQFFFPTSSRAAALATARRHLRSGGRLQAPVATDDPGDRLFRVLLASWGIPLRSADELAAEIGDAGFTHVELVGAGTPGPTSVRAVRP